MHHTQLKSAVKKYGEDFKNDPENTKLVIQADHSEEDAKEIIAELSKPVSHTVSKGNGNPTVSNSDAVAEAQANHPHYKWFDEFEARIQKKDVMNPYTNQNNTIITGWELTKKKHPKFFEPHLAKEFNLFAIGFDTLGVGNMYIEKDTMTTGQILTYEQWAKDQGKDLSKDMNILLNK